jgi:hypothetical protein
MVYLETFSDSPSTRNIGRVNLKFVNQSMYNYINELLMVFFDSYKCPMTIYSIGWGEINVVQRVVIKNNRHVSHGIVNPLLLVTRLLFYYYFIHQKNHHDKFLFQSVHYQYNS